MLKTQLLHPDILQALAAAGHGSTVLIADGNYPAGTCLGPRARLVHLNLSPGILGCVDVLSAIGSAIPIESARVMQTADGSTPPIWTDFQRELAAAGYTGRLDPIERFAFYAAASTPDHALTIQTAEQRTYANLLLTIGVRS